MPGLVLGTSGTKSLDHRAYTVIEKTTNMLGTNSAISDSSKCYKENKGMWEILGMVVLNLLED